MVRAVADFVLFVLRQNVFFDIIFKLWVHAHDKTIILPRPTLRAPKLAKEFLTKLKERLDAAKSETEREQIEQAVRWGLAALDNREEPNQHEDQ